MVTSPVAVLEWLLLLESKTATCIWMWSSVSQHLSLKMAPFVLHHMIDPKF